tara:strand:+ start:2591 stop:2980 length:390 start_codon:yes stop_codon:yes gene_type:complete
MDGSYKEDLKMLNTPWDKLSKKQQKYFNGNRKTFETWKNQTKDSLRGLEVPPSEPIIKDKGMEAAKGGSVPSTKKSKSKLKKAKALAVTIIIPTGSTKKASMMAGGMANKRKHMYPGGGYVTDKLKGKY